MGEAIILRGLVGSHPLGALAAFGLLRCCEEVDGLRGSRLGWREEAGWCAVLKPAIPTSPEALIEALVKRQQGRASAGELNWADTLSPDISSVL